MLENDTKERLLLWQETRGHPTRSQSRPPMTNISHISLSNSGSGCENTMHMEAYLVLEFAGFVLKLKTITFLQTCLANIASKMMIKPDLQMCIYFSSIFHLQTVPTTIQY